MMSKRRYKIQTLTISRNYAPSINKFRSDSNRQFRILQPQWDTRELKPYFRIFICYQHCDSLAPDREVDLYFSSLNSD